LSHEVGWGYKDVVDTLEEKRKVKALAYYERKVRLLSQLSLPSFSPFPSLSLELTLPSLRALVFLQTASVKLAQKATASVSHPADAKLAEFGY